MNELRLTLTEAKKLERARYFVGSNGDAPDKLYFNIDTIVDDGHLYIDSFDSNGDPVDQYKLIEEEYVTSF